MFYMNSHTCKLPFRRTEIEAVQFMNMCGCKCVCVCVCVCFVCVVVFCVCVVVCGCVCVCVCCVCAYVCVCVCTYTHTNKIQVKLLPKNETQAIKFMRSNYVDGTKFSWLRDLGIVCM